MMVPCGGACFQMMVQEAAHAAQLQLKIEMIVQEAAHAAQLQLKIDPTLPTTPYRCC